MLLCKSELTLVAIPSEVPCLLVHWQMSVSINKRMFVFNAAIVIDSN